MAYTGSKRSPGRSQGIHWFQSVLSWNRFHQTFLSGSSRWRKHWLALLFLAISLICGLRLVYVTPMGQMADEPSHIARAVALLHGQIIGTKATLSNEPQAGMDVDNGIVLAAMAEFHPDGNPPLTEADRAQARAIPWANKREFDPAIGTVVYLPSLYIPGAAGVGLGGLIGLNPLPSLYLGRIFMLAAFVLLGTMALFIARAGQGLFFALLCLPMTISLGATFNQDGMIIACCVLAAALLTRNEDRHPQSHWIAAAILAVVLCSKPPYGLLLCCAALPIFSWKALPRLVIAGLFGLPALIWLIIAHKSFIPHSLAPYSPGPLWPGDPKATFDIADPAANIRVLLHRPWLVVTLSYQYIGLYKTGLRNEFFGDLGWLNVLLTRGQYLAWELALAVAAIGVLFGNGRNAKHWRAADAMFVLALLLASVIAICMSLYLAWTRVGASLIDGVQGRYFLPLTPFVVLILPRLGALTGDGSTLQIWLNRLEALSVVPAILLACYDIFALPALVQAKFG